ncbi:MAG: papain-like cysteine protease family protein [Candidatus Cloacimonetes bacterium]|nr:papain-like cysteine protease family protein [Candidatus Cloacimonadota bacterium]
MKTNHASLRFLVLLLLIISGTLTANILDVQQVYQSQTQWCWAASSQAVLNYYGFPCTQDQIAQYGTEGANEWNWLWGESTNPTRRGIDLILNHFGSLQTTSYIRALTLDESNQNMLLNRPFFIRWEWSDGSGHFLVTKGVVDQTIHLMDPWYGPTINSYDWTLSGSSHTWTHSLGITTSPAAMDPQNPYPEDNATNVSTTPALAWTNNPNALSIEVLFDTEYPPVASVYSGDVISSLSNTQLGGELTAGTSYYWRIIANLGSNVFWGPVWTFQTGMGEGIILLGNGAITNGSSTYPAPYGNRFWGAKHQMLIPASELMDAGLHGGDNIERIGFNVASARATPLSSFTIKLGHTDVPSLTDWISGLTTVCNPVTYTDVTGWNYHDFDTPYVWDGESNLVVETCFNNSSYTGNSMFYQTTTPGYYSTLYYRANNNNVANSTSITYFYEQRPNMLLKISQQMAGIDEINVVSNANNILVSWGAVAGANSYKVYAADTPYPDVWGEPIAIVDTTQYSDPGQNKRFYRVVASSSVP